MTASLKMRQLESKIADLQQQYTQLLKIRQQEITSLMSMADLAHLDDKTLIGGLLFLKEKTSTQDPIAEVWHAAGEKFLRQYKPKLSTCLQSHKERKQGGNFPQSANQADASSQTSAKKGIPSKPTSVPQTTDQPPQKHPQPGKA